MKGHLDRLEPALRTEEARVYRLAFFDALTGLPNRGKAGRPPKNPPAPKAKITSIRV